MIALPVPFNSIPFHRLSYVHPSPIHSLPNLTQYVHRADAKRGNPKVRLWTKREDQAGPLTCYGNKYRKFEYIIPDIKASKDVSTVVSEGAIQSNHTVQVASIARVLGLRCTVLLHRGIGGLRAASNKDAFVSTGNVQLNRLLGADVRVTDQCDTGDEKGPLIPILQELRERGEVPYWIPSGASLHPLGGLGYARCAFEIASQERQLVNDQELGDSKQFDYIFVACGSGSTLAGLIAGFKLLEKRSHKDPGVAKRRIIGIMTSPTKSKSYQEDRILGLTRAAAKLIGLDPETDISPEDITLDDRFTGEGYGILDQDTAETVELAARLDSLLLDPVYTAKVMRGMMHFWDEDLNNTEDSDLVSHEGPPNALFLHTGGQSALGAYADVWPGP